MAEAAKARSLFQQLAGVAGYVQALPRGERAELRRLNRPERDVPPEVFWRIVGRYEIALRDEGFWLAVLPLMVGHPHQPGVRPGDALANAEVKGSRLERWLRLDRERALQEAGRLLSKVDGGFDWSSFGHLLRYWSERDRRRIAREFFLSPAYRQSQQN